jgi:hypothetical protein
MKDAHVQMMRNLCRERPGDLEVHEESLNRVPVFGIQIAGKCVHGIGSGQTF